MKAKLTAEQVDQEPSRQNSCEVDQVSGCDADFQGDLVKYDLPVGVIGAEATLTAVAMAQQMKNRGMIRKKSRIFVPALPLRAQ